VIRLIVGVVILVLLGVLFGMNGANVTDLNLFGYRMQNVPVIGVAIAGFVLGVLYSFILYFMRFVDRRRRTSLQNRDRDVRDRERSLQDKEKQLKTLAEGVEETRAARQEAPPTPGASPVPGRREPRGARRRRPR
jgi:uncharacterized integral membrane protein